MIAKVHRSKYDVFALDIETHNDEESIAKRETSMWLGCCINEEMTADDPRSYFYTWDEWLEHAERYTTRRGGKRKNMLVYVFNLSFEWSFLLPVLLKNGFEWRESVGEDDAFVYNTTSTKTCSSVWIITLKFRKTGGKVVFHDMAKLFAGAGSLRNVAKSFGLPTQKGDIDYRLNRLHGHVITDEEKEYCFKDTRILIDIAQIMNERKDASFFKAASAASYAMEDLIKFAYGKFFKPYAKFREEYPELDEKEQAFLRGTVEGGICYATPRWQFKDIRQKILHIDGHSFHPSSAYLMLFPHGRGEYFTGRPPLNKISACRVRISYDGVRLHSLVKLIGLPFVTDLEITVWDFEVRTMAKCYENLKVKYIDGYAYNRRFLPWRGWYRAIYDKRKAAKAAGDPFQAMHNKIKINASYGKFLERPHDVQYENIVDGEGLINSKVHSVIDPPICAKYTYLPVGSCIPAYSRVRLIDAALRFGWEKITYFDTDSIFVIYDEDTAKVWSTFNQNDELGGWGLEEVCDRAQFAVPKRYKTMTNGETTVKAGGMNFYEYMTANGLSSMNYEETNIVSSKWKVQRAFRCKGGTLIDFQEKEMKVPEKYLSVYHQNT